MNILVLELKRIGDLILTLPALSALKKAYPGANLTLCLLESCEGLLPGISSVDEPLVYRYRGSNARLLARLVSGSFDICLDFTGNDRAAFFAALSRAKRRISFGNVRRFRHRAWAFNEFVDSNVVETHTVDHHLNLLRPLGIRGGAEPAIELAVPEASARRAGQLLRESGINGPFAVVHPGTARAEKYWEPDSWATVIDYCQEELGLPCVITGSRAPFEQAHLADIRSCMRTPWRDFSGGLDLMTLAALIRRTSLLLSMDSAPVHIGAAFATPQIALFGQTNPFVWRPRHSRAIVLFPGESGPLAHFVPNIQVRPLRDLPTQTVIGAVHTLYPHRMETPSA